MIRVNKRISIKEILHRITRHPLLRNVSLEDAIYYASDFIEIFGMPNMFEDKIDSINVKNHRAELPCGTISVKQVKHKNKVMTSTIDNFEREDNNKLTFKVNGNFIFTSLKEGVIDIAYRVMPIDENGFPLILESPVFMRALSAYIKKEVFTILFDTGKINYNIYESACTEYGKAAAALHSECLMPSESEMETITNMMHALIPKKREFENAFKNLGDKEAWKY